MKRPSGAVSRSDRIGGVCALIVAAAYLSGIALLFAVLIPAGYSSRASDLAQQIKLVLELQGAVYLLNVGVYIISGIFQLSLTVVLYGRLKAGSPLLTQTASAFGLIWAGVVLASGMIASISLSTVAELYATAPAQAAAVWLGSQVVQNGLGGGTEIVGGLWIALISGVAWRAGALPRALNVLGVVTGVAGILSILPAREVLVAVFGLGSIVWFIWLGTALLRGRAGAASPEPGVGHLDTRPVPAHRLS